MKNVLENNEALRKAHEQYKKFTGNPEYLEAYEARMKRLRDQNSLIHSAEKRGKTEGMREKALQAARRMLEKEYPVADVIEVTGLTEEDLHQAGLV